MATKGRVFAFEMLLVCRLRQHVLGGRHAKSASRSDALGNPTTDRDGRAKRPEEQEHWLPQNGRDHAGASESQQRGQQAATAFIASGGCTWHRQLVCFKHGDRPRSTHDGAIAHMCRPDANAILEQHQAAGADFHYRPVAEFRGGILRLKIDRATVDADWSAARQLREVDGAVSGNIDQRLVRLQCVVVAAQPGGVRPAK